MYKNFTLFIFTLFVSSTFCIAQSNFTSGYIIEASGDTIHGFLDDRSDLRNSHRIKFRVSENATTKEYLPSELLAYKAGTKVYRSNQVTIKEQAVQAFLELINDGPLKLYFFKDADDKVHYYAEKAGELHELTNDRIEVERDGRTFAYYNKAYIGILNALSADCKINENAKLGFNLKELSKQVSKYNECKGEVSFRSEKTGKKIVLSKSIYTGINISKVVGNGHPAIFKETAYKKSSSAGIGLHLNFPNINDKIFIDLVAGYNAKGGIAENSRGDYEFNLHYINFNPGISYVYPKGRFRPTIGAGLVAGYLLNTESAYIRYRNEREDRIFNMSPYNDDESNTEIGYEAHAGLKYVLKNNNALVLKARYSKSMINFDFVYHSYYNELLSLQIGYEF